MPKTWLMMVAGERSGDVYGARLATALKHRLPEIEIFGCGGDAMRQAGVETTVDASRFAMVGITEVISGLPQAYHAFHALLDEADRHRPELAILIDAPRNHRGLLCQSANLGLEALEAGTAQSPD